MFKVIKPFNIYPAPVGNKSSFAVDDEVDASELGAFGPEVASSVVSISDTAPAPQFPAPRVKPTKGSE